jgi:hypothetical protein
MRLALPIPETKTAKTRHRLTYRNPVLNTLKKQTMGVEGVLPRYR